MKILYFDCFSGISGDMTISALLDLGIDQDWFTNKLKGIPSLTGEFDLNFEVLVKKGVRGRSFKVIETSPAQHHRDFKSIKKLITDSGLDENIQKLSINIFEHIAQAEARIHHQEIEKIHFHEVGALDSIIDIIGIAILIQELKPDKILSSPVTLGKGMVQCQHGMYPVPALATLEILKTLPVLGGNESFELTTPTGAAVIRELVQQFEPTLPNMRIEKIGYGAGSRDLVLQPNILRTIFGTMD